MKLSIKKCMFCQNGYRLLSYGGISVYNFKYSSGVEALKVKTPKGGFVVLPFKGQQLWEVNFLSHNLVMNTTAKEPVKDTEYLKNYGGFLYHRGINSFGSRDEIHPQHGEIPNAEYDSAYIITGEDEKGKFIKIGGELNYDTAFVKKYRFSPSYTLYENGTVIRIDVKLQNLKNTPMEYMYLCHINFKPIDGLRLIYSVPRDKEHIKIHTAVDEKFSGGKGQKLSYFMERVKENLCVSDTIGIEGECYDPEICYTLKYETDGLKRGYTMAYKEGFGAYYVSHPADVLPVSTRWISRTKDEDALGMVLPGTAEHLGYKNAAQKGQIKYLDGKKELNFYIEAGFLDEDEAKNREKFINGLIKK